jgi:hypothetical protein
MRGELRLALRRFAHEPALATAAVLTLALGIGACTAMFSIVEAVLLKPMDIATPDRLVVMWPQVGDTAGEFTYNAYRELARTSASFARVALTGSVNWPIPTDIVLLNGGRARDAVRGIRHVFRHARRATLSRPHVPSRRRSPRRAADARRQLDVLARQTGGRSRRGRTDADDRRRPLDDRRRDAARVLLSVGRGHLDARGNAARADQ